MFESLVSLRHAPFALLVVTLASGCEQSTSVPTASTLTPTFLRAEAHEDLSRDATFYVAEGLPDYHVAWSGSDMKRAAAALRAVAEVDPESLPRHQSAQSGAIFARIISDENLQTCAQEVMSGERVSEIVTFAEAFDQIAALYESSFLSAFVGGRELVELTKARLRNAETFFELASYVHIATEFHLMEIEAGKLSIEKFKGFTEPIVLMLSTALHWPVTTQDRAEIFAALNAAIPSLASDMSAVDRGRLGSRLFELRRNNAQFESAEQFKELRATFEQAEKEMQSSSLARALRRICTAKWPHYMPRDESLTLDRYTRLGVPDLSVRWSIEELQQAVAVLQKECDNNARVLPRSDSEQSGKLFAKLLSVEILDEPRFRFSSPAAKSNALSSHIRLLDDIYNLYSEAWKQRIPGDREMLAIDLALLRSQSAWLDTAREQVRLVDASDPTYAKLRETLAKARELASSKTCLLYVIEPRFRRSERLSYARAAQKPMSVLAQIMYEADRDKYVRCLDLVADSCDDEDFRQAIVQLTESIRDAKADPPLEPIWK